jgi:hypothetical protein
MFDISKLDDLIYKSGSRYVLELLKNELTEEICIKCVKNHGYTIRFVPEEFQTDEICEIALNQNVRNILWIKNPSEYIIDFVNRRIDVNKEMFKLDSLFLVKSCKDYNSILEYFKSYPGAFKYVNKKFHTKELCIDAIKYNPDYIKYIEPTNPSFQELQNLYDLLTV